ncbi:hypothetical protein TWF281_005683 [Arthrobotrys megalospora]
MRQKKSATQRHTGGPSRSRNPLTQNLKLQNIKSRARGTAATGGSNNSTTTINNHSNSNFNFNFNPTTQPPLTFSDAYKGNLLLYEFLTKYSQKVFLERNITRILDDQARLLKAENEGRKGGRRYWNRDGKTRKMSEIVRRLGVVPEFDDEVKFALKVREVRGLPREWFIEKSLRTCECEVRLFALSSLSLEGRPSLRSNVQEEYTRLELLTTTEKMVSKPDPENEDERILCIKRPLVNPLPRFAVEGDEGLRLASSGYEIRCQIRPSQTDDEVTDEASYEACLRLDENLVYDGGLNEATLATEKVGDSDPTSETPQLKLDFGWNKRIGYQIVENEKEQRTSNTAAPSKRRKLICIDYTFRGHVKNFDEQDSHKNSYLSTVNLNNKLYAFSYQGPTFTCVICQNTTFKSLERLRFHLLHTHMYFSCSLEEHTPGKHREHVKITVAPAVEEGKRSYRPPGNNDRRFLWIRPKGLGDRAFNMQEYLKGDTTWARGVAVPEAERKLLNAPGRILKKMQIVPDLGFTGAKRRCVAAVREDGKGYMKFQTREAVAAGDDVSESGDEIDEGWVVKRVHKRIEASEFSSAGQEFLKLWGDHIMVEGPRSNRHLHDCLIRFCRKNKKNLRSTSIRQEYDKFMTALKIRRQIDKILVKECKRILDSSGV